MNIQFKFNKRNRITETIDHASLKKQIYCFLFCGKYQYLNKISTSKIIQNLLQKPYFDKKKSL